MASKNNADVVIGGKVFRVCGYESEEYLQKVANYINGKIAEYTKEDSFRRMSPEMRANILYLNISFNTHNKIIGKIKFFTPLNVK